MACKEASRHFSDSTHWYDLWHTNGMSKIEPLPKRNAFADTNPRIEGMVKAIFALVDGFALTNRERELVLRQVSEKLRPIPVPRAGDALSAVVQLIPRNRDWTVKELKSKVEWNGSSISDKELYNAIGYLTRKHHIQRVGPGRYIVNGIVVTSTDNLGGQPSVIEGDLDD